MINTLETLGLYIFAVPFNKNRASAQMCILLKTGGETDSSGWLAQTKTGPYHGATTGMCDGQPSASLVPA